MQKSFFESAGSFLLKSNIFIAIGASCVAYITLFLLNLPVNYVVLAAVFFESLLVYNINRLTDIDEDKINVPERMAFINRYTKPILAMSALFYIYYASIVFSVNTTAFFILIFQTLAAIAYSIFRIKKYFFIKNALVAFTWGTTVLFAGSYYGVFNISLAAIFAIIAFEFFVNNTIFDIKDMEGDRKCNIKTIANTFGAKKTILLGCLVNTFSVLILFETFAFGLLTERANLLFLLLIYVYAYLYMAENTNNKVYYGLFVDGEFLFTAFFVLLYGMI